LRPWIVCWRKTIASPINLPLWDNSAVDGYAVHSSDVADANENSPIHLRVTATVPAGTAAGVRLEPQDVRRGFSRVRRSPKARDAVVMQEDTRPHHEGYIAVEESVELGENIRRAGDDVTKDEIVLRSGRVLGPAQVGMAAAVGLAQLTVYPRPRVGRVGDRRGDRRAGGGCCRPARFTMRIVMRSVPW